MFPGLSSTLQSFVTTWLKEQKGDSIAWKFPVLYMPLFPSLGSVAQGALV